MHEIDEDLGTRVHVGAAATRTNEPRTPCRRMRTHESITLVSCHDANERKAAELIADVCHDG